MRFLIIAGEVSGEVYGARLMREIKRLIPRAVFTGIGGDRMRGEGLEMLYHCRDMAAIGVMQMLEKSGFFIGALKCVRGMVREKRFDAIILVDYPGFNIRIARAGRESGIPVFYYVLPQIWAWREYRIHALKKNVDTLMAALPFEKEFYASHGVNVHFVGHPMLDEMPPPPDREALRAELLPPGCETLIGLLPGSRSSEVRDMTKPLVETADRIRQKIPSAGFVIPAAPHIPTDFIKSVVAGRDYIKTVAGRSREVMAASDLVITKSGTATLEAALFGTPMVIVYCSSHVSFWLAKLLAKVKYAGLPNIIAGREVAREMFQYDFTPEKVAEHAVGLLTDPAVLETARNGMESVRAKIGQKGAAGRAAAIIYGRLKELNPGLEKGGEIEPGYF